MSDGNHDGESDAVQLKRKRGRPRKARDLTDDPAFAVLTDKKIPFVRDGKRESLSPLEALEQQAFASAWDGKPSAIIEVLTMIASNERARLPAAKGLPRFRWEHTPASIDDVLVLLQIATPTYVPEPWEEQYGRTLQLDPEAVAFALASHPPNGFNAERLKHVQVRTREAERVSWPEAVEE